MSEQTTTALETEIQPAAQNYGSQFSAQDIADMEADARGDDVPLVGPVESEMPDDADAEAVDAGKVDVQKPVPAQETLPEQKAKAAEQSVAAAPQPFVPQYAVDAPADADKLINQLRAEKRAAHRLLLEGDSSMTFEQFAEIEDRVDAQVDAIKESVSAKRLADSLTAQNQEQYLKSEWQAAQNVSMSAFKGEGLDYLAAGNEDKLAVFNGFMKTLGGIQANSNRDSTWFFTEAHKMTKAYLGATAAPPPPPAASRAVNRAALPPTLARAPMAAVAGVEVARFAHLDAMTEAQVERAIARMSPDERLAYYRNE
jgi:biopolymer transport protein ExbD